jgi:hypothetical protein
MAHADEHTRSRTPQDLRVTDPAPFLCDSVLARDCLELYQTYLANRSGAIKTLRRDFGALDFDPFAQHVLGDCAPADSPEAFQRCFEILYGPFRPRDLPAPP